MKERERKLDLLFWLHFGRKVTISMVNAQPFVGIISYHSFISFRIYILDLHKMRFVWHFWVKVGWGFCP